MSATGTSQHVRRAVTIVQVAITVGVLLGFAVLAIDTGHVHVSRAEMQAAIDSAALAGASGLLKGSGTANERAIHYAGRNLVAGTAVSASELTVTVGNWEGTARAFHPATGAERASPNALRVVGARGLALFFGPFLGVNNTGVKKRATGVVGSGICAGVWGLEGITGDGDITTDSYDSQNGSYGSGNIHRNGDICSCRNIDLFGGVQIYGDAMYGEGYGLGIEGTSYEIWGIVGEQRCGPIAPPFDMEEAAANNDNSTIGLTDRGRSPFPYGPWDLVVTGNDNLTLDGGKYYCTSVQLDGQGTLTIAGPTTIYLAGPGNFTGGGVVNVSEVASDLVIYSTGPTLNLSGNAGFYGGVIAPEADIILEGTGDYYGTILGRFLDVDGNATVHVDERLVFSLFGMRSVAPILVE